MPNAYEQSTFDKNGTTASGGLVFVLVILFSFGDVPCCPLSARSGTNGPIRVTGPIGARLCRDNVRSESIECVAASFEGIDDVCEIQRLRPS